MHRMLAYHYKQIKAGRKAEYPAIVNEAVDLGVKASSEMDLSQTDITEEHLAVSSVCALLSAGRLDAHRGGANLLEGALRARKNRYASSTKAS
jgi:hypothetical protein